jgi:hypothetical protein
MLYSSVYGKLLYYTIPLQQFPVYSQIGKLDKQTNR